jgi:hypothetical protein
MGGGRALTRRTRTGAIITSHARGVKAVGRTATNGVDRTAVDQAQEVDRRPICAWALRETEDTAAAGFARFFDLCSERVDGPVLSNALVAARARPFIAFEQQVIINGEPQQLTVVGQAGQEAELQAFLQRLAATKPENLVPRWFPEHDTAAAWLWYEVGKLMAWTYYDVFDALWAALEGQPGADFVLPAAGEDQPDAEQPDATTDTPDGQPSEDE